MDEDERSAEFVKFIGGALEEAFQRSRYVKEYTSARRNGDTVLAESLLDNVLKINGDRNEYTLLDVLRGIIDADAISVYEKKYFSFAEQMNAGEKLSDLCIYMMRTSNLHGDTFAGLLIKRLPEFDVGWEGLMGVYQHLLIRAGKIEIRPDDEQEKNNSSRTVERYERVLEPIRKRLLSLDDVATLRRLYALILDGEGMEEDVNFVVILNSKVRL